MMDIQRRILQLLYVLLCVAFRTYVKVKGLVMTVTHLLFHRQSRHKILSFVRVDEDEVVTRLRLIEKLPRQIILSVWVPMEKVSRAARILHNVALWSSRLQIQELVIYVTSKQEERVMKELKNHLIELYPQTFSDTLRLGKTTVRMENFKSFHSEFIKQQKESQKITVNYVSPLVLLFNNSNSICGTPFPYLVSGEMLFVGQVDSYTILEFQENLKEYAGTKQRCGK